jgi:hypothetical protein
LFGLLSLSVQIKIEIIPQNPLSILQSEIIYARENTGAS